MSSSAQLHEHVNASLCYLGDTPQKPVIPMYAIGSGQATRMSDEHYAAHTVAIYDARRAPGAFSLDREGFELVCDSPTAMTNFYNDAEVRRVYYAETIELVKHQTGAVKVLVFDCTVRAQSTAMQQQKGVREAVRLVHNDYTVKSGPQRVRDLVDPEEAVQRLGRRFAIFNLWRPIRGPVQSVPLAVCDARSVHPGDLVATDLDYGERTGEIYQVAYNPDHRWYYYPGMRTDEALLFKCFDSMDDGRARFTPHTAFDDPHTPPNAPNRESIELRCLSFF